MDNNTLEIAAFRAWPADEEQQINGVVLRATHGYTKRANSANLVSEQQTNIPGLVQRCEDFFVQRQLPPIFRFPKNCNNNAVDRYLKTRGYKAIDRSLVMAQNLSDFPVSHTSVTTQPINQWLSTFSQLNAASNHQQVRHLNILQHIQDKKLPAILKKNGRIVCCGLGVLWNGCFGLFNLSTDQQKRNNSYATALLHSMLQWAKNNGAHTAYLQVTAKNTPAIRLYDKLGYKQRYEYWYRIKC